MKKHFNQFPPDVNEVGCTSLLALGQSQPPNDDARDIRLQPGLKVWERLIHTVI